MLRYGLDAPGLVKAFFLAGIGLMVSAALVGYYGVAWAAWILTLLAAYPFGMGLLMLYESLLWKPRNSTTILDLVPWTGGEQVLDVGCGRGIMLISAARRLTTGRATGVDLWLSRDQARNSPEATLRNAAAAGVADCVVIATADMRTLPCADASFDIVVSQWVLHNLDAQTDRLLALSEMWRVLRPGGRILLADIVHRHEYVAALTQLGATSVRIIVAQPVKDRLLSLVSFGSYQPATVMATRT